MSNLYDCNIVVTDKSIFFEHFIFPDDIWEIIFKYCDSFIQVILICTNNYFKKFQYELKPYDLKVWIRCDDNFLKLYVHRKLLIKYCPTIKKILDFDPDITKINFHTRFLHMTRRNLDHNKSKVGDKYSMTHSTLKDIIKLTQIYTDTLIFNDKGSRVCISNPLIYCDTIKLSRKAFIFCIFVFSMIIMTTTVYQQKISER
jgi:hypothetical protein